MRAEHLANDPLVECSITLLLPFLFWLQIFMGYRQDFFYLAKKFLLFPQLQYFVELFTIAKFENKLHFAIPEFLL